MEHEMSYEKLFETLMREKNREELTPIGPEFYTNARDYVESQSKGLAQDSYSHVQSLNSILKEIFSRREKKILTLAAIKARTNAEVFDVSVMSPEERELFNNIVLLLLSSRSKALYDNPQDKTEKGNNAKKTVLKAVRDIEAFVGEELETYGPYRKDDIVNVPESIARVLLKRGDVKDES